MSHAVHAVGDLDVFVLYQRALSSADGYVDAHIVFGRSRNGGETFTRQVLDASAVGPNDPYERKLDLDGVGSVLLASWTEYTGTGSSVLYAAVSGDLGVSWTTRQVAVDAFLPVSEAVSPTDLRIAFLRPVGADQENVVARSFDAGLTWTEEVVQRLWQNSAAPAIAGSLPTDGFAGGLSGTYGNFQSAIFGRDPLGVWAERHSIGGVGRIALAGSGPLDIAGIGVIWDGFASRVRFMQSADAGGVWCDREIPTEGAPMAAAIEAGEALPLWISTAERTESYSVRSIVARSDDAGAHWTTYNLPAPGISLTHDLAVPLPNLAYVSYWSVEPSGANALRVGRLAT